MVGNKISLLFLGCWTVWAVGSFSGCGDGDGAKDGENDLTDMSTDEPEDERADVMDGIDDGGGDGDNDATDTGPDKVEDAESDKEEEDGVEDIPFECPEMPWECPDYLVEGGYFCDGDDLYEGALACSVECGCSCRSEFVESCESGCEDPEDGTAHCL